jgi:hypothetical protein
VVSLLPGAAVLPAAASLPHLDAQALNAGLMLDHSSYNSDASMRWEHAIKGIASCTVFCRNVRGVCFDFRNVQYMYGYNCGGDSICLPGLV